MSSKYIGVAVLVLGAALAGCNRSNRGSSDSESAETFPAVGISFYSEDTYSGLDVDDSIYFGNREASLFYYGRVDVGDMNPYDECARIYSRGNYQYLAVGTSQLGGYSNYWKKSGSRRYGSLNMRQGDAITTIRTWTTNQGQPLSQMRSGLHLVCLMSKSGAGNSMGVFFNADPSMKGMVNINLQFQNDYVEFSEAYNGSKYRSHSDTQYQYRRPQTRQNERQSDRQETTRTEPRTRKGS